MQNTRSLLKEEEKRQSSGQRGWAKMAMSALGFRVTVTSLRTTHRCSAVVFLLALCCQINYCEALSLPPSRALISLQDVPSDWIFSIISFFTFRAFHSQPVSRRHETQALILSPLPRCKCVTLPLISPRSEWDCHATVRYSAVGLSAQPGKRSAVLRGEHFCL